MRLFAHPVKIKWDFLSVGLFVRLPILRMIDIHEKKRRTLEIASTTFFVKQKYKKSLSKLRAKRI